MSFTAGTRNLSSAVFDAIALQAFVNQLGFKILSVYGCLVNTIGQPQGDGVYLDGVAGTVLAMP